jgi:hypothetical protein
MSGTAPTPLTIRRAVTARHQRTRTEIEIRLMTARRRDTARNGYRGPLTRAELAARTLRRSNQEN